MYNTDILKTLDINLKSINNILDEDIMVRSSDRCLFFSGVLVALSNSDFYEYLNTLDISVTTTKSINIKLLNTLCNELYGYTQNDNCLDVRVLYSFLQLIDCPVYKYIQMFNNIDVHILQLFKNTNIDIISQAYKIFLSKSGKIENKNIVLTPPHIRHLMIQLADLSDNDVVLDSCMGTGGFLIDSMLAMISKTNNVSIVNNILQNQLIGYEIDATLYICSCCNFILHKKYVNNLIHHSSILDTVKDYDLISSIKRMNVTKIVINPPYESNKPIKFVLQALDYLQLGGKLIIIMPTPTLTHNQGQYDARTGQLIKAGLTEKVLNIAKLDFVIKCPEKLFSEQNRTVNTSIFGFTKTPHKHNDLVLFYNLSDDGFISIQHKGRVDKNGNWEERQESIYQTIQNLEEIDGISDKRRIYDEKGILNCSGFKKRKSENRPLVRIGDLFLYEKGALASDDANEDGEVDFITASAEWKKHTISTHECEAIVFAVGAAGSLGRTHYVNGKFIASNLCLILTSRNNEDYPIDLQFYNCYFESIKEQLRNDLADGTSKLTIRPEDLMNYYIEYISYDEQIEYRDKYINTYQKLQQLIRQHELDMSKVIRGM